MIIHTRTRTVYSRRLMEPITPQYTRPARISPCVPALHTGGNPDRAVDAARLVRQLGAERGQRAHQGLGRLHRPRGVIGMRKWRQA